jgi:uncharacterized membrane protein
MSYWQTVKELNTLWYTLFWVLICFPVLGTVSRFFGYIRRGDHQGAAAVVVAVLTCLVLFYFVIALFLCVYKVYTAPPTK